MDILKSYYPRLVTLAFSPDGEKLAVLSAENKKLALEIWEARDHLSHVLALMEPTDLSWEENQTVEKEAPEALLRWSQYGTYLALARRDGAIDVWFAVKSEHRLSFHLEEGCQTLTWGNIHPSLAVSSTTKLLYWDAPYLSSPTKPSFPLSEEVGSLGSFHPTALTFSPDDRGLISGGEQGELLCWEIKPYASLAYRGCTRAPRQLPIASLWYAPDGTRLLAEQYSNRDSQRNTPWRARSMLFLQTQNWLSFGTVEHDLIGWSTNSRRLLGTRWGGDEDQLWLEQLDAWTGACVASTPLNISAGTLQTIGLADKGTQVVWCVKHFEFLHNLEVDSIPL
jgi:WD40 repeat protein